MAVRTGELRRWRQESLHPGGTFLVLRCEGSFHPAGSRAGDPMQLHWTILHQDGTLSPGWWETLLERGSELLGPPPQL